MARFSIGHVNPQGSGAAEPEEFVQVEADDIDSPVSRVIDTGDTVSYDMACDEIERLQSSPIRDEYSVPSPRNIAAGMLGRGATVNRVD